MHKDLRIDGFVFGSATADATDAVIRMIADLDRKNLNFDHTPGLCHSVG